MTLSPGGDTLKCNTVLLTSSVVHLTSLSCVHLYKWAFLPAILPECLKLYNGYYFADLNFIQKNHAQDSIKPTGLDNF